MKPIPFRDVHLDFHTSEFIGDVGVDFDPEEFAHTLINAHVNTICIFARCHHGYCYYPTKVGVVHPGLKRKDLLGEMIEVLKTHKISVGVYTTVAWDELNARLHPEWRQVKPDKSLVETGYWKWLCLNSPYADWVEAHIRELLSNYQFDRFFIDIVMQWFDGCVCDYCLSDMEKSMLNPENPSDRRIQAIQVQRRFMKRMKSIVEEYDPEIAVYFNRSWILSANPDASLRKDLEYYSYVSIESLPTGGWGYNHFPLIAHYLMNKGIPLQSLTGRFHKSWGDFGGLKSKAALEYECLRVAVRGIRVGVGDQLHPRGRLDQATYRLIGYVYSQIERLEPWLKDTEPVADIGILIANGTGPEGVLGTDLSSEEGAMRILMELGHQFLILDEWDDFSKFKLLILPDHVYLSEELTDKLERFLEVGGRIIASYFSGLSQKTGEPILRDWPIRSIRRSRYSLNYLRPIADKLGLDVEVYDYALYEPAAYVEAVPGAEVLAKVVEPYFDRTAAHFCSHRQTPPDRDSNYPAIVRTSRIVYFAFPIFRAYKIHGFPVYKFLLRNAINHLMPEPILKHNLPSTAEVVVRRLEGDYIVHILHYVPQRRAEGIDIVEEALPINDVNVAIRTYARNAYLIPSKSELAVEQSGNYTSTIIPTIKGHAHVVFET
ncbi:MAG: beta-galactosidase trimerization domain-containing protein [Candidatus Bathyarchaeia archaeon]